MSRWSRAAALAGVALAVLTVSACGIARDATPRATDQPPALKFARLHERLLPSITA